MSHEPAVNVTDEEKNFLNWVADSGGLISGPFNNEFVMGLLRSLRQKGLVHYSQWRFDGREWEDRARTERKSPGQAVMLTEVGWFAIERKADEAYEF